jgi:hypothetical protein
MNEEENKYTVNYFIKKFKAIPNKQWCTGSYETETGNHCALGHCGFRDINYFGITRTDRRTDEGRELLLILPDVAEINDGIHYSYSQATPRGRVLAALKDLKKGKQRI